MADMKALLLFPIALLAASCGPPPIPYSQQRPPMRNGEPYYPYGQTGRPAGPETGTFEPIPDDNQAPPPPRNQGPQADAYDPEPPAPAPQPRQDYPYARKTNNPNQVVSPYAPYNVIDVEGFKSGQPAKDPSNGKIFRVP